MKCVCDACGWEYDETVGDPENRKKLLADMHALVLFGKT